METQHYESTQENSVHRFSNPNLFRNRKIMLYTLITEGSVSRRGDSAGLASRLRQLAGLKRSDIKNAGA